MAHQPSQSDRAPNEGLTVRAEAALTHPATLIALATLLVNDLVFKSLWHGSWWTGKLSDLAWVIFASPLLALPLTFLARRNPIAQKTAWVIAYIGLPFLYAAYNTFESLHDVIMGAFSLVRGTPGGSPFDPSDSIVIPIGFAVAMWVWRTVQIDRSETKAKLSLIVAVLACVASVATTAEEPPTGISVLGQDESGNVVAKDFRQNWGDFFISSDGGVTWEPDRENLATDESIDWNLPTAEAPEGTYSLEGPDVALTTNGITKTVHSTLNVNSKTDYRIFALATDSIGAGFGRVTHLPTDIHYDAGSGNLIVAVGLQGVLLRTRDGRWQRIGVGKYNPIDFSVASRAKLLIVGEELGTLVMALIIASVGSALSASTMPQRLDNHRYVRAILAGAVATVLTMMVILLVTSPTLDSLEWFSDVLMLYAFLLVLLSGFVITVLMVVAVRAFGTPSGTIISSVLTLLLLVISVFPLLNSYTEVGTLFDYSSDFRAFGAIVVGFISLIFVFAALIIRRSLGVVLATVLATAGMMLAALFVFLLWISGYIDLLPAKVAATALVWTVALVLYAYVRSKLHDQSQPPIEPPTDDDRQSIYPVRLSKNAKDDRTSPCPTTPSTTPPSTSQTRLPSSPAVTAASDSASPKASSNMVPTSRSLPATPTSSMQPSKRSLRLPAASLRTF